MLLLEKLPYAHSIQYGCVLKKRCLPETFDKSKRRLNHWYRARVFQMHARPSSHRSLNWKHVRKGSGVDRYFKVPIRQIGFFLDSSQPVNGFPSSQPVLYSPQLPDSPGCAECVSVNLKSLPNQTLWREQSGRKVVVEVFSRLP